nr:DNA mismatch repair protein MSH5 isoform X2 [Ipomoea batatas]
MEASSVSGARNPFCCAEASAADSSAQGFREPSPDSLETENTLEFDVSLAVFFIESVSGSVKYQVQPGVIYTSTKSEESFLAALQRCDNTSEAATVKLVKSSLFSYEQAWHRCGDITRKMHLCAYYYDSCYSAILMYFSKDMSVSSYTCSCSHLVLIHPPSEGRIAFADLAMDN